MKIVIQLILVFTLLNIGATTNANRDTIEVLIYTKAAGFVHESRVNGAEAIKKFSADYPINVSHSEDSTIFRWPQLNKYNVIVFLSTSKNVLDDEGREALKHFVQSGKGFVGIHSASATEYDWPWFGELVGAYFDKHPKVQEAIINVKDSTHISTKHLPKKWLWKDEWYNWHSLPGSDVIVLLTVDETTYEGGKHGDYHPVAWCREFDGGRSWYTALGHLNESYEDENFTKHILGGIIWAAGRENDIKIK